MEYGGGGRRGARVLNGGGGKPVIKLVELCVLAGVFEGNETSGPLVVVQGAEPPEAYGLVLLSRDFANEWHHLAPGIMNEKTVNSVM